MVHGLVVRAFEGCCTFFSQTQLPPAGQDTPQAAALSSMSPAVVRATRAPMVSAGTAVGDSLAQGVLRSGAGSARRTAGWQHEPAAEASGEPRTQRVPCQKLPSSMWHSGTLSVVPGLVYWRRPCLLLKSWHRQASSTLTSSILQMLAAHLPST